MEMQKQKAFNARRNSINKQKEFKLAGMSPHNIFPLPRKEVHTLLNFTYED